MPQKRKYLDRMNEYGLVKKYTTHIITYNVMYCSWKITMPCFTKAHMNGTVESRQNLYKLITSNRNSVQISFINFTVLKEHTHTMISIISMPELFPQWPKLGW
jgi:uncharacterized membrane protein